MSQLGFLLLFCVGALSQHYSAGKCPAEIVGVPDFKEKDFMGIWYEQETYLINPKNCKYVKYIQNADGKIEIIEGIVDEYGHEVRSLVSQLKFIGNATNLRWSVNIPGQYPYKFWILDTDYTNYAVLFSCLNMLFVKEKLVWILSRTPVLLEPFLTKTHEVLAKHKLSTNSMKKTTQENCPVVPA